MKRKTLLMFGLTVMIAATNVIGVSAAEGAESKGTFVFETGGSEITPPVDPEYPDEDLDPDDEDGGGTGNVGALRIDYVSDWKFGTGRITSGEQIFNAALVKTADTAYSVPNFVQVSDLRGSLVGWKLTVSQEQFKVADGDDTLRGAEIRIRNINTTARSGGAQAGTPESIILKGNGVDEEVMLAEKGAGNGIHVAHFGYHNTAGAEQNAGMSVQLVIPATAKKLLASYESILVWTLSDVPGNEEEGGGGGSIIVDPWRPGNGSGGTDI